MYDSKLIDCQAVDNVSSINQPIVWLQIILYGPSSWILGDSIVDQAYESHHENLKVEIHKAEANKRSVIQFFVLFETLI